MRLLVDEHGMDWEQAWRITQRTCAYTNHTLLAEALEKWPRAALRRAPAAPPRDHPRDQPAACSTLSGCGTRATRSWSAACRSSTRRASSTCAWPTSPAVGSHAINGVAALHTELLKQTVLSDFHAIAPEKFFNVTNGVTPRRWLALSNPRLSALITGHIGDRWIADLENELRAPRAAGRPTAASSGTGRTVKAANKRRPGRADQGADRHRGRSGVAVRRPGEAAARIQAAAPQRAVSRDALQPAETRRRHLGRAAHRDLRRQGRARLSDGQADHPADHRRRRRRQCRCRRSRPHLKVVFLPDFNVKTSQHVYPAADLSEQISTAGKEASGTGNMKFAMNGALTIGTLDGANVEIRDAVGPENFFLFGLTAPEVAQRKAQGYRPRDVYESNPELRETLDLIGSGLFSNGDREMFQPLLDSLLERDDYLLLADYQDYVDTQQRVSDACGEPAGAGPACPSSTAREWAGSRRIGRSGITAGTSGTSVCRSWEVRVVSGPDRAMAPIVTRDATSERPGAGARAIAAGGPAPLGATVAAGGVNFSVFAKRASSPRGPALRRRGRDDTGAGDSARRGGPSQLPLLARVRAGARAGAALRLSRARTVRARAGAPVRRRQGAPRSVRPGGRRARRVLARRRQPAGRQQRRGDEERRGRSRPLRLGRRRAAPAAVRRDRHLRDARAPASPGTPAPASRPRRAAPMPA